MDYIYKYIKTCIIYWAYKNKIHEVFIYTVYIHFINTGFWEWVCLGPVLVFRSFCICLFTHIHMYLYMYLKDML